LKKLLLDVRLPFSYNHLLFRLTLDRFPDAAGVGVAGPSPNMLEVLAPRGLGVPNDDRLPPPIALCNSGLAGDGEYGELLVLRSDAGLARGELMWLLKLAGDPPMDGVLEYRGGVL